MLGRIVLATALTLTAVTMASAQGQGDARERAACRPDVMRFCKQVIKDTNDDVFSILNCVQSIERESAEPAIRSWSATASKNHRA